MFVVEFRVGEEARQRLNGYETTSRSGASFVASARSERMSGDEERNRGGYGDPKGGEKMTANIPDETAT